MPHLTFLPWLVALILCAPMLFFVLYPLYSRTHQPQIKTSPNGSEQPRSALSSQLENEQAARTALTEVELDYQLGNLAESDYHSLRERYIRRAFSAHKSIQASEQHLDDLIEARLRQMRTNQETPEAQQQEGPENAAD